MATNHSPVRIDDQLHPADERILEYFAEEPPDYVPLAANRLGMHLGYVERRVETLVENGLLEPVSQERIYTITDRGQRCVESETALRAGGGR